jgi:hypothetical protein
MAITESNYGNAPEGKTTEYEIPANIGAIFDDHLELLQENNAGNLVTRLFDIVTAIPELDAPFIGQALQTAALAHLAQQREITEMRYLTHPIRVAILAVRLAQEMNEPVTDELIASALLHDTIEDSPTVSGKQQFTEKTLKETHLAGYHKKDAVAKDAEALNHNTVMLDNQVDSIQYLHKIHSLDKTVFTRRQIIKTADRIDNLLDPPTLSVEGGIVYGTDYHAVLLREKRPRYINKTRDPQGIIQLLVPESTFPGFLVQRAADISLATIRDANFTPKKWREHVPTAPYARFAK